MMGAGVTWTDDSGSVRGDWVDGSWRTWTVDYYKKKGTKRKADAGAGAGAGAGAEATRLLTKDYHDNVSAAVFIEWFEDLCKTLADVYGGCEIMMDGARYHLTEETKMPNFNSLKGVMQAWLAEKGIAFAATANKTGLYELIKEHKQQHRDYKVYRIASKYGHMVRITPPYHPELQVIEKIWAAIKNPIAMDPIRNKKDMQARVLQSRDAHVSGKLWVKVRNHVLKKEDEYWAMMPPAGVDGVEAAAPNPEDCDFEDD
jgi:hypothetical protein